MKPGQYVTIESVTANASKERGITFDTMYEQYLDCIQGGVASYTNQKNVWWYRDTFTEPQDMTFCAINGGIFIYKIMVSDASPIAVNAIQNISAQKSQRIYYTLSGTPVLNPEAPGLYFCEGKKFLLK